MNYEAGTEERKGLTKCLNFKRPETILRVQAARLAPPPARIYTDFFRVYHGRRIAYSALPSCRDLVRPVQLGIVPSIRFCACNHIFQLTWKQKEKSVITGVQGIKHGRSGFQRHAANGIAYNFEDRVSIKCWSPIGNRRDIYNLPLIPLSWRFYHLIYVRHNRPS